MSLKQNYRQERFLSLVEGIIEKAPKMNQCSPMAVAQHWESGLPGSNSNVPLIHHVTLNKRLCLSMP